jgi:hypothetical protein
MSMGTTLLPGKQRTNQEFRSYRSSGSKCPLVELVSFWVESNRNAAEFLAEREVRARIMHTRAIRSSILQLR